MVKNTKVNFKVVALLTLLLVLMCGLFLMVIYWREAKNDLIMFEEEKSNENEEIIEVEEKEIFEYEVVEVPNWPGKEDKTETE
jgi:formylmethanofuran dehydrogenase subunit E